MAILVVGGSTKDIGKTALVCAVIAALREFDWTAVKIAGHSYEPAESASSLSSYPSQTIWEETIAGQDTDTARYLAAGARRALLVTRQGAEISIDAIRATIAKDRNIIFESNQIIDAVEPDVCIALIGRDATQMKPSFMPLLRKADALVGFDRIAIKSAELPSGIPRFALQSLDCLSPEMVKWLQSRFNRMQPPASRG